MSGVKAIQEAKVRLFTAPSDHYHNLTHHYAVLENAHLIWQADKLSIDIDDLELAVWCHDLFKGAKDGEIALREYLEAYSIKNLERVINIVSEHSFGQTQTSTESKLLYDSDKIDLVSVTRWKYVFDLYEEKLISAVERDKYIKEWNRRMPLILNSLHFSTSNKLFALRYESFIDWLKTINRYKSDMFV